MELYVLRQENYNEWAWENGACDLIGVYDDKEKAVKDLQKCIDNDLKEERYLDLDFDELARFRLYDETHFYVNVYLTEEDRDNGHEAGTYVIEKKLLNDMGVLYNG